MFVPRTGGHFPPKKLFVFCLSLSALSSCALKPRPVERIAEQKENLSSSPREQLIAFRADDRTGVSLPKIDEGATLADYRLHAALNNPGLEALYHDWQAARERAPQARSLPEPRLSYTEFLEEVETRVGPQERKFGLSQKFPWFGTLSLRGEIEEEAARVAWQRLLAAQLVLDVQLRRVYSNYYFLARSREVTRENIDLLLRLEGVATQKLAAGADNHPAVIRLQIEIGRLEDRLRSFEDRRRPLTARLNALLNRAPQTVIPWPTKSERSDREEVPDDELFRFVEENNPDLIALQHQIRRADLDRRLTEKAYFPDFSVGVETVETGSAVQSNTHGSGNDPWTLMFSVEIPIWYSKYRSGEREAEARWRSARKRETNRRNQLRAELELALYERRDASRRISLHTDILVPKSIESLRATEESFRSGSADFLDLIDAQRVLLEFRLAMERAMADRMKSEAAIDRLMGRFVIPYPREREEASS